jgi:hypothetical protein
LALANSTSGLVIKHPFTRARQVLVTFLLLPSGAGVVFLGWLVFGSGIWSAPPATIAAVVIGIALSPQFWSCILAVLVAYTYWRGSTRITREGDFLTFHRLPLGRWLPHKIDLGRYHNLSVSVLHYPRDERSASFRPAFRPRVVVRDGVTNVFYVGEALSVAQAESVAQALCRMLGVQPRPSPDVAGHVEQALQPDAPKLAHNGEG